MELKPVSWGDGGEFVEFEKPIPIHGYNRSRNLDAEFDGVEGFEAAFIPKAELDAIMEYPGSEQLRLTKMSIKIPSEIGRGAIKKYVTYLATPMPHNGFDGPFRSPFGVSTKDGVQYSVAPTCPPIWRIPMSNDMKNVVEILTAQQEIKYISGLSYKLPWQTKVAGFISQPINWLVGNTLNLITLNFRGLRGL
ncbi:MAG: hypothetical protein JNJ57_15220 [Saprospiraceae bacterium]|nr:hypothetical protein [Saprospiraceae bacterium]